MSYASDALIDALTRENNQLKEENTKLKENREHLFQFNVEKNREILSLLIRNRELKELLLESFVLVKNNEPRLVSDRMAKRMRDLGIEIPK